MSDTVWISGALQDSSLVKLVMTDISDQNADAAIMGQILNQQGKSVAPELCPKKIWGDGAPADFKTMPDLFWARCQWIVSSRAADVLRRFDLGGGALYPVTEGVFQSDRKTRVPGDFFCWIFGNVKSAFLPDESPTKRNFGISDTMWHMP